MKSHSSQNELPDFAGNLIVIPNYLPEKEFKELQNQILGIPKAERGFIPGHKKGGTIAYNQLKQHAPAAADLYTSQEFLDFISRVVHAEVETTPIRDLSSLTVLVYEKPGDHIGWHYDTNFYKGRFFTALLGIENRGDTEDGLSSARLLVRKETGDKSIPTPPNTLVLFEGPKVLHRATQLKEGERRVMLSMTFSTDPHHSVVSQVLRRFKDTAFFGVRALCA